MNQQAYFTSPSYRLETLQHLQGFLTQHWINAPQSSKQEWWDKMEANRKEIERVSKLKD